MIVQLIALCCNSGVEVVMNDKAKFAINIAVLALISFGPWACNQALAGEAGKFQLSAHEDNFYSKFGGRVFTVYCGKREVSVWKKADGRAGWLKCSPRQLSANAWEVTRKGSRWVRK